MKSLFPESMLGVTTTELSMEIIAQKFDYFFSQIHLLHLQTSSYAEHSALNLWQELPDDKDSFIERLSGYEGRKLRSYKFLPIIDYSLGLSSKIVGDLKSFAEEMEEWAKRKDYCDIENLSQALSGSASKTLFLLTLS